MWSHGYGDRCRSSVPVYVAVSVTVFVAVCVAVLVAVCLLLILVLAVVLAVAAFTSINLQATPLSALSCAQPR